MDSLSDRTRRVLLFAGTAFGVASALFCAPVPDPGAPADSRPAVLSAPSAFAAEDPAELLAGENVKARLARAEGLKKEQMSELVQALVAMSDRKLKKGVEYPEDLDFLAEFTVAETTRALRLLAIGAGQHLGAAGFAERLRALADGEQRGRSARAAEALGYVGGKADLPRLLELAASSSQSIAVFACEALAKLGDRKTTVDGLIKIALEHANPEVADHATWAALDLLKNRKALLKKLKKAAGKDEVLGVRRGSLEAMLLDGAEPMEWDDDVLKNARDTILAAAATVPIETRDKKHRAKVESALAWLQENMPGALLVVRASTTRIEIPGKTEPKAHVDLKESVVCVPLQYAGAQSGKQLAYHLLRVATVLFDKRIGNPYQGHRGWENAISDTYDLCRISGAYNAGRGGINRDAFLETILSKRPWGGN